MPLSLIVTSHPERDREISMVFGVYDASECMLNHRIAGGVAARRGARVSAAGARFSAAYRAAAPPKSAFWRRGGVQRAKSSGSAGKRFHLLIQVRGRYRIRAIFIFIATIKYKGEGDGVIRAR